MSPFGQPDPDEAKRANKGGLAGLLDALQEGFHHGAWRTAGVSARYCSDAHPSSLVCSSQLLRLPDFADLLLTPHGYVPIRVPKTE